MKNKKPIDPHETMYEVPYKLCTDNTTIHSKIIGIKKYWVDGFVFEDCESHSDAYDLYMEQVKKKGYNNK